MQVHYEAALTDAEWLAFYDIFSPYDIKIFPSAVEVTSPKLPTQNDIITVVKSPAKSLLNLNAE